MNDPKSNSNVMKVTQNNPIPQTERIESNHIQSATTSAAEINEKERHGLNWSKIGTIVNAIATFLKAIATLALAFYVAFCLQRVDTKIAQSSQPPAFRISQHADNDGSFEITVYNSGGNIDWITCQLERYVRVDTKLPGCSVYIPCRQISGNIDDVADIAKISIMNPTSLLSPLNIDGFTERLCKRLSEENFYYYMQTMDILVFSYVDYYHEDKVERYFLFAESDQNLNGESKTVGKYSLYPVRADVWESINSQIPPVIKAASLIEIPEQALTYVNQHKFQHRAISTNSELIVEDVIEYLQKY